MPTCGQTGPDVERSGLVVTLRLDQYVTVRRSRRVGGATSRGGPERRLPHVGTHTCVAYKGCSKVTEMLQVVMPLFPVYLPGHRYQKGV